MNIGANGKTIAAATRELSLRWEETKNSWQDSKSQEFEHKYIAELLAGDALARLTHQQFVEVGTLPPAGPALVEPVTSPGDAFGDPQILHCGGRHGSRFPCAGCERLTAEHGQEPVGRPAVHALADDR